MTGPSDSESASGDDLARLRAVAASQRVKLPDEALAARVASELNGEEPLLVATFVEGRGLVVATNSRVIEGKLVWTPKAKSWQYGEMRRAKRGQMGIYAELKLWTSGGFMADEVMTNVRPQRQARRFAELINERTQTGKAGSSTGTVVTPTTPSGPGRQQKPPAAPKLPPAGWYADPDNPQTGQRRWDGHAWTADRRDPPSFKSWLSTHRRQIAAAAAAFVAGAGIGFAMSRDSDYRADRRASERRAAIEAARNEAGTTTVTESSTTTTTATETVTDAGGTE